MKTLSFLSALILSAIFVTPTSQGQASEEKWRKVLSADLVTVKEGKMIIEKFDLFKTEGEGEALKLQVKLHAECPEGAGISRDNFVAFTMAAYLKFLENLAEGEQWQSDALESLIGKADVEVNIAMTKEGFQIQGVNNKDGVRENNTVKWADQFPKK